MEKFFIYVFSFFLAIFLVAKAFFGFDEEFLVVCSFFIVLTLLVRSLSDLIKNELDSRAEQLHANFLKFYEIKKDILFLNISYYERRNKSLVTRVINFFFAFYFNLINSFDLKVSKLISYTYASVNSSIYSVLQKEISHRLFFYLLKLSLFSQHIKKKGLSA